MKSAFDALAEDARLVPHRIALDFGGTTLRARVNAICNQAEHAVRNGATYLVLDDRGAALPVPAVLAAGAVHQRLTSAGLRMQASVAACDGFARDAHGCAAVIAAGANVVTPWLAARAAAAETGGATALLDTLRAGLVKVLAKLGICTLRSYVGAQTFEVLGLQREVVDACFPGMTTHVATLGFDEIEEDVRAWDAHAGEGVEPPQRGLFRYRRDGVKRHYDPPLLKSLRKTIVARDEAAFLALSDQLEARETIALRDLVEPVALGEPIPLDEVEHEDAILARFVTAAMSLGALGPEAHEAVALGAKLAGARSNGGEGGEDPAKTLNAIKQVASARFGVAPEYLATAEELEIKIAQGAKPGEGGQIPGFKVTAEIAVLRGAAPGQSLVSPPPHHDIYSIEDLAQLIYDLRRANAKAKIAVKLVAQSGIGYVASGVAKARADVVHIAGHDGGTGASPLGSIKHAGLPWELGLVETHHTLECERFARARRAARGRRLQDRPRRRRRVDARRGHVRLRHRAADRAGLHLRAPVPSQHVSGGDRDARRGAARQVPRHRRGRGDVPALRRARRAAAARRAGRAFARRDPRPQRPRAPALRPLRRRRPRRAAAPAGDARAVRLRADRRRAPRRRDDPRRHAAHHAVGPRRRDAHRVRHGRFASCAATTWRPRRIATRAAPARASARSSRRR